MEKVVYQAEISWMQNGKQIIIKVSAGDDKKLFERLKKVIESKSKWSLNKLFN